MITTGPIHTGVTVQKLVQLSGPSHAMDSARQRLIEASGVAITSRM
jgi:hypothetical protein